MSIRVMTLVWDVPFPSLPAKMIALKLADCANDQGENIFPSVGTIERATGCAPSTIRKWLAALEHAGLLEVVERSLGGANRDTTIRRFDMERLRALADGRLALVEETVSRPGRDGQPVPAVTLAIVPTPTSSEAGKDTDLAGKETPPRGGGVEADPSTARTPPLHGVDPTPPRGGGDPSTPWTQPVREPLVNRQGSLPPLPPNSAADAAAGGGEFAKGWTEAAIEAVDHLRSSATARHVASEFIDRVAGVLNPPREVAPAQYVRHLARLQGYPAEVLAVAAERMLATRKRDLPAVPDVEAVCAGVQRATRREALDAAPPEAPELRGAADRLRAGIEARLGAAAFAAWFEGLRLESRADERAVVSVPTRLAKTWIDRDYERALLLAAQGVWPDVVRVDVVARVAAAPVAA